MTFTQESPRTPTEIRSITVTLINDIRAVNSEGDPQPYRAQYHIQLFDQDDNLMKDHIGDLLDHYSAAELQPIRDFIDQLRIEAEAQILGT